MSHLPTSSPRSRRRASAFVLAAALTFAGVGAIAVPTEAQTPTSVVVATTTPQAPVSPIVTIVPDNSLSPNAVPSPPVPGTLKSTVLVTNPGSAALTNLQMVLRFGAKPDQFLTINDGSANVGVIDALSGSWYHTIATLAPSATATYIVTWVKYCPGKWPLAARAGDRLASVMVTFVGVADSRCPGDENANPQPASFFQLPWPPSSLLPVAPTTTLVGPTSIPPPSSIAPIVSSTLPAPTSSNVPTSTTPGPVTTAPLVIAPTLPVPTTRPALSPTATTILSLPRATTTTIPPSTTRPATTVPRTTTTKPGTVIFCKTVGGRRYCAPKSSVYKEGQEKTIELKPGQKPPKTKAKPKTKKK